MDLSKNNCALTIISMADQCDQDPSIAADGNDTYYDREGAVDANTIGNKLKAFTTRVASKYLDTMGIAEHWKLVADLAEALPDYGSKITVKGGLALHYSVAAIMDKWISFEDRHKHVIEAAQTYILSTYAATSDLDTGIAVEDLSDLNDVVQLVKEGIENLRHSWAGCAGIHAEIVRACNEEFANNRAMFASDGVTDVQFFVDSQHDQEVTLVPNDGVLCTKTECVKVTALDPHPIFISDNGSLVFRRRETVADFYLIRAKWSVRATVTKTSGDSCGVTCPAELIDVAIPRESDSRRKLSAELGMGSHGDFYPIAGIYVPMVSMKYQLIDLINLIKDVQDGGVDPKIGKRIHRYIILSFMNNLIRYQSSKNNDDVSDYKYFLGSNDWLDLVQLDVSRDQAKTKAQQQIDERHDFLIDTFAKQPSDDGYVELDTRLSTHLCELRDVVVHQTQSLMNKDFSGIGGGMSFLTTWAALGAVPVLLAVLSSMSA